MDFQETFLYQFFKALCEVTGHPVKTLLKIDQTDAVLVCATPAAGAAVSGAAASSSAGPAVPSAQVTISGTPESINVIVRDFKPCYCDSGNHIFQVFRQKFKPCSCEGSTYLKVVEASDVFHLLAFPKNSPLIRLVAHWVADGGHH